MSAKTGMTAKVVTTMNRVLKGYIAEDAKAGIVECLDNEANAFATVNEARFELCKRLGAVKASIIKAREENKDSVPRGAWKYWAERNLKGQLQYSKANAYANVGMDDEPHKAFEDYKARDTRYKAKAELKAAKLAAQGLGKDGKPLPVETGLTQPEPSAAAGQSDAGKDSRADHEPPNAEELAAQLENVTRALVVASDGNAAPAIRNAASVAGVPLAPEDGFVLTSETSVNELVEALMTTWSPAKRARLAVELGVPQPAAVSRRAKARRRAKEAFAGDADEFAKAVTSMAA